MIEYRKHTFLLVYWAYSQEELDENVREYGYCMQEDELDLFDHFALLRLTDVNDVCSWLIKWLLGRGNEQSSGDSNGGAFNELKKAK